MKDYKTIIHLDSSSINDIFRLPCTSDIHKTIFGCVVYEFYGFVMAEGSDTVAGDGDFLCELYDGKWVVEKNKNE